MTGDVVGKVWSQVGLWSQNMLVLEESFHDAIRDVFTKSVVEELQCHSLNISKILSFLVNPDVISVTVLLKEVMRGEAGESALELVKRVLHMPSDGIL